MNLQPPPIQYDANFEIERNMEREDSDLLNRKQRQDLEIATGERLILSSPNGTRFKLEVSDLGVLTASAL